MVRVILFAGFRDGGKTTAIAMLTKALVRRGRRVGTLKHVHVGVASIDKKGKDSWIHSRAGASPVVVASPDGMVVYVKRPKTGDSLTQALKLMYSERPDYVFIEGYYARLARMRPPTVLCATRREEADALAKVHRNVLFICGRFAGKSRLGAYAGVPLVRLPRDLPDALGLIAQPP